MEVLFGCPSYLPALSIDYHRSLMHAAILLTRAGIEMQEHVIAGNCFIDQARNRIVDYFLEKTEASDLIFVDSDVGFDANCLGRLLNHPQEIVAGLVPKRDRDDEACYHMNALTGVMENTLFQCLEAPTAFMRIKRSAFERLKKPFFRTGSNDADFGEDIYFCRRWCETGQFLWIDSDITFTHRGSKVWTGNFYDHAVKSGYLRS